MSPIEKDRLPPTTLFLQVRFIEYMPFDGNVWSDSKLVTYRWVVLDLCLWVDGWVGGWGTCLCLLGPASLGLLAGWDGRVHGC